MNNKEFTSELSHRLGYTIKDTSELMSSLLSGMTQQLEEGNIVTIQGFGTFEVRTREARMGRNPRTGETMEIPASKVPAFKASAALKNVVNEK